MSDLPMRWRSLLASESIIELPLVLAGPILRRTTPQAVTVWVALKAACQVELRVFATEDNGDRIGTSLLWGSQETIAVGRYLHIIAVTAIPERDEILTADRVYAYDLTFTECDLQIPARSLLAAMSAPRMPDVNISYFAHGYPTFVLPASQLEDLRIGHGSCRKPHGDGFDALSILDRILAESAQQPSQRPQQLFLTGDQIYGDDVAAPLLWVASQLGDLLLGWTERLPLQDLQSHQIEYRPVTDLAWGERAEIATCQAGFTAGLRDRRHKVASHLFGLGEYYAVYLLTWSPVCWPQVWPAGSEIAPDRQIGQDWDRQVRQLELFRARLPEVRRALANIPLYTIFDDHEISDDWNLNRAWCLRVLGKPLGKQVVQNALLAYAVFQGWGNTPDRFERGTSGGKLLAAAHTWSHSRGTDSAAHLQIARLVGMPQNDPLTGLPKFVNDGADVAILDRDPAAVVWNYTIDGSCHEVVVLDTRTWRGYPLHGSASAAPMLLSPTGFDRQLIEPLRAKACPDLPVATFVIAPTNLVSLKFIDWIHAIAIERRQIFAADVGDAWNINTAALAQLLMTLFALRDRVVVLSGDIHYGSVVRLAYRQVEAGEPLLPSVLVQLTASALRNEELKTRLLHTRLKEWLLPEKNRSAIGWNQPPQMLPFRSPGSRRDRNRPHDWECDLDWIFRQRTSVASFEQVPDRSGIWQSWLQRLLLRLDGWFQDGREVVGLNNLAVVRWQSQTIVQDLYWREPGYPYCIVYSRFVASIAPHTTRVS